METLNVGDLVETSVLFGSEAIDPFLKGNRVCFLLVENVDNFQYGIEENEKWFYALPQFALNYKGIQTLTQAKYTGYPHTRSGYWLLRVSDCKKISELAAA